MWGNLKNLGSKMEQIGSAIAPVLAVDDEEEYSEYEDYEEYEEYEEGDNNRTPFGFVGMITKALDREQRDYSESHPEPDYDEDNPEEVIDLIEEEDEEEDHNKSASLFNNGDNESELKQQSHEWSESYDTISIPQVKASTLQVDEHIPISPSAKLRHASQLVITSEQKRDNEILEETLSDNHTNKDQLNTQNASADTRLAEDGVPIVVESSKPSRSPSSPYHPEESSSSQQHTTQHVKKSPATSKIMLETEPRRPSLIREKGSVSPNTPKMIKRVGGPSRTGSNDEVVEIESPKNSKKPSFLYAPPLASEASSDDDDGDMGDVCDEDDEREEEEEGEGEDEEEVEEEETPIMSSPRLTKEAIEAQQSKESDSSSSSQPKTSSIATSHSESSTSPGQKQRQAFKLPPPRPPSSPATTPNLVKSSITAPNSEGRPVPQAPIDTTETQIIEELRAQCQKLENQLKQSESQVKALQKQLTESSVQNTNHDEDLFIQFQEKEARLLEAAEEEHQQQLNILRGELEGKLSAIQRQLKSEQAERQQEKQKLDRQLEDARRRAETVEREAKLLQARHEAERINEAKTLEHSLRISEDKLARSMALLDERDEEVAALKKSLKSLQSTVTEHREGVEEVEEEIDELHAENESLRQHVEVVESQCTQLKMKVEELQADSEKLTALKLELRMMQEDRDRDRAKIQSVTQTTSATSAQLESERAALAAEVHDLKRQLSAAHADIDVARVDTERVMTANTNLQHALEAFQSERDAELALLDDQRRDMEEAIAAAHAAALEATHEANEAAIRRMKREANEEADKIRMELKKLEEKNEHLKADNVQMRRSLDEAIQRLQSTQEDIIDRTIMKNILLDWLSKPAAKERRQVLEVMANLLHFTEEEKEKVHLVDEGAFGKIVHSVAQLPPPKADVEHLKGENVREKWVNFLLSEIED